MNSGLTLFSKVLFHITLSSILTSNILVVMTFILQFNQFIYSLWTMSYVGIVLDFDKEFSDTVHF